ncbi:MAG: TraR/DksA C4-type zinc finger protein [Nitrospirales bacterium]|nr:TraR/DksA C4-type zinc finger protein [Nitrospirales bacterium]
MTNGQAEFERLLEEAVAFHGHLCAGQVLGVRMAIVGLRKIGIRDPKGDERKDIMVFVEIDRCATDAIMTVTGCKPGKRTLKIKDYGKMAATFVNLSTGRAVRVRPRNDAREKARAYCRDIEDESRAQLQAYRTMPDDELLETKEVAVNLEAGDFPGKPLSRVRCEACGEAVMDRKEVKMNRILLCRPCAAGADYYSASDRSE